jgi:8-hydroxy-5-deazaflavin:NADPH oxidoreductase
MRVGMLGAGRVGGALTRALCRAGFEVVVANRRGRVSLMPLVDEVGSGAVPAAVWEAARAPIVVLAVPFEAVEDVLAEADPPAGTVLVDATNAWGGWDASLGADTSSQAVAAWAPEAHVVKALNTVHASQMAAPGADGAPLGVPVAGDDPAAVRRVGEVLAHIGMATVALGPLHAGRTMEPGGPLFGLVAGPDEVGRVAAGL